MIKRLAIALVLTALVVFELQTEIDVFKADFISKQKRPFVPPRVEGVKHAGLGYHTLIADAYWLQAIQYATDLGEDDYEPDNLYYMTDFITDLDPRFAMAYHLTGINLMISDGDSTMIADILEKGKRNRPDYWKISFDLGFFYYFYLLDAEKAGENIEIAYKFTGHPAYAMLAARIRSEAGSPELGIKFLTQMREQTEDEKVKEKFDKRIMELQTTILEREMNVIVERYYRGTGAYPSRLEDLVQAGLIAVPPHPLSGHVFLYDTEENQVRSDPIVFSKVHDPWAKERKGNQAIKSRKDGE